MMLPSSSPSLLTRMQSEEMSNELLTFLYFVRTLAIGHREGIMLYMTGEVLEDGTLLHDIYSSPSKSTCRPCIAFFCFPIMCSHTTLDIRDAIIVERLFNSNLVVIVSQREPRVMHLLHLASHTMICNNKFSKSILNVKLNREVICL